MRIALDARTLFADQLRGIGKTLGTLYRHLLRVRPDWQVIAYHRQRQPTAPALDHPNVRPRFIEMPGDRLGAWERFRLPLAAWRDGADVLHCPANTCPSWLPTDTIATIHDLIPLDMAEHRDPADVAQFERGVRHACRQAGIIMCPSSFTRSQLAERFNVSASRMRVIPWGPTESMRYVGPDAWTNMLERYDVRSPFALHFGATAERKNTARVLRAWAKRATRGEHGWQLVVVGLPEPFRQQMRDLAVSLGIERSVSLHGYVSEAELPTLLSAADMLLFPSLAEGFGVPLLEAWATRTPVLTSSAASLPEIASEAALFVDPHDTDSIAHGVDRLIAQPQLRHDLIIRGLRRLNDFSWQATVDSFASTLESIVASRRPWIARLGDVLRPAGRRAA